MVRLIRLCCACLCTSLLLAEAGEAQIFTDVTEESGLQVFPGRSARNVVFVDYDNDGFQDVFITENEFFPRRIGLYHNTGNGRFVDQTFLIPSDLHLEAGGSGAIFGDYDNDGDEDLLLPVWPHNVLLRNDHSRFVQMDVASDLTDSLAIENALWLDYDRDGYLDLYVTSRWADENYAPRANRLLGNNGDGTFTDQTAAAGLDILVDPESGGSSGGMAAGDFNDDGWPDLYLGVFRHPNRLFLSDGQGRFADATTDEIGDVGDAFSLAIGDINNDGRLDIFQGAGGSDTRVFFRSLLLLNRGAGEFLDITENAGLGLDALGTNTTGTGFADIDNDGDLDLFIGFSQKGAIADSYLMLNDGTGQFTDATALSGIEDFGGYVAFGDYDEDGFVDLLFSSFTRELTALYHNNGNTNHWLRVELVGVESNRNGIGARLIATSGDLEQIREILGGLGRQQDEKVAHFGLGERTQVERLEIRWPSGQVDVLRDISADQKIRVFEGQGAYQTVQPTTWGSRVDSLVMGSSLDTTVSVHPELFGPGAEINSVRADLSAFGGSATTALQRQADGSYALQTPWQTPAHNGFYPLSVTIDQQTLLGPYWTRLLWPVVVLPEGDASIFAGGLAEGWTLTGDDVEQIAPFAGRTAAWLPNLATLIYQPETILSAVGYTTLHFAFHPGEATAAVTSTLRVRINGQGLVTLFSASADSNFIAIDNPVWQEVDIPLAALGIRPEDFIKDIRFLVNMRGSVRLADIRLVAVQPPPLATAVMEQRTEAQPTSFDLAQNYPNPFNSGTVIRFALPQSQDIALSVYNLVGQKVTTLLQGQRAAGSYAIHWDGRDDAGRDLASGMYLYRFQAGTQTETRKLLLLR